MSPGEQRRAWAWDLVSRASGHVPAYGSLEWLALPNGPEKVAAVVLAAEKCLIDWEFAKQAEDTVFTAQGDRHRTAWTGDGFRPDPCIAAGIEREWREWVGGAA